MLQCWNCEREFAPVATRWLCPYCKAKSNCCDGEPLGEISGK